MFGYNEPKYDVKATFTGKSMVYELREIAPISCVRPNAIHIPYIAVTGKDVDLLLKYRSPKDAEKDWKSIIDQDDVKLDELNFSERIEGHHIGYGRDGSVTMF